MTPSPLHRALVAASLTLGLLANSSHASPVPEFARHMEAEAASSFIFLFKPHVPRADLDTLSTSLLNLYSGTRRHLYHTAIKGFSATISAQAAERLAANNPNIASYGPNAPVWAFARPPWAGGGTDETDTGSSTQTTPWGITRIGGPRDGSGRHAWVIDTGIDLDHPDLNVGSGANFVLRGKDSADDGNGHGTHVAGTIAALDNNLDVVGVAAGATVHPVRVLDNSGSGTFDAVIAGVDHVAANASPGDCANMSLGADASNIPSTTLTMLATAITNAAASGIKFSLAAGNSAAHAGNFTPAQINGTNIYTVSAIDDQDRLANFSNYGNPPVDYAAPGVLILSTKKGGGTTTLSGTSMAAPHVCGLLLLGNVQGDRTALGDPDGTADPIAHQ